MSESFLYVQRNELIEKVKQCWASGFSQESLIYRHAQDMDLMGFGVAVGIQKMIFGERSFVMFTADPKTAAKDPVLIAGYGIGEGVVQERVPVDHYFVSGKTGEIKHEIATKDIRLTFNEQAGSGLIEAQVPKEEQDKPCLTDDQIRQLVGVGQQIESLFGLPQDIEGTFTQSGELYILQARPIALDYSRQLVWTNTNVTESYPGVSSALTYTHAKYFYRVIFYDSYIRLGVKPSEVWSNFQPLDNMIGYLNGHVYYCLSNFYLLHKQSPLFPLFEKHWEDMIGLNSSYKTHAEGGFSEWVNKIRTWSRFGIAAIKTFVDFLNHERSMYHYHAWWDQLIAPLRGKDLSHEDPLELVNLFYNVWTQVGTHWGVTLTTDAYLIPLYGWTEALFERWNLHDENPGLLSDLLCGDEKLLSVEIILSSVALAEYVRDKSELRNLFETADEKEIWKQVEQGSIDTEFKKRVEKHLHYFGDRGLQELKMEQPSLRDTPWVLMRMVKQYVAQDVTVESYRAHERQVREKADQELDALLADSPGKKYLLTKQILPRLRKLIRHRENSRYCRSELFGFSKKIFTALAEHLVQRGILKEKDDIYHLTQEEIFGYFNGMGVTENLQAIADIRKKEYESYLGKEVPEQITTLGAVRDNDLSAPDEVEEQCVLKGLGSSAGKVVGTACVVEDPNAVEEVSDDMILIARETDPGWLFLMLASKGMVVERGSMLSHTAITGRKFGIPTIVALPAATKRIPNGARIEIDGSSGVVTILDTVKDTENAAEEA